MDVITDSQCSEFTVTHHLLLDQSMNSVPVLKLLKALKWSQEGCPVGVVMDLANLLMDTLLFPKMTVLCSTPLKDTPHSIHNEQWFKNLQYVQMITHWDTDDNENSVSHQICWHVSMYLWTVVISSCLPVVSMNSHHLLTGGLSRGEIYTMYNTNSSFENGNKQTLNSCDSSVHQEQYSIYTRWDTDDTDNSVGQ